MKEQILWRILALPSHPSAFYTIGNLVYFRCRATITSVHNLDGFTDFLESLVINVIRLPE